MELQLEVARMRVIQADYCLLKAHYKMNEAGAESIAAALVAQGIDAEQSVIEASIANLTASLKNDHPRLESIEEDLKKIIDSPDDNNVNVRLISILERLKQVGEHLCVTHSRNISWSTSTSQTQISRWTDDNLLKEAHDIISEIIEDL